MSYEPQEVSAMGIYRGYPLNAASAAEKALGMSLDATGSAVGATGSATVTLTLVDGDIGALRIGDLLDCDTGANYESVAVTAINVPALQFTAVFTKTHAASFAVRLTHGTFVGTLAIPQIGTAMTLSLYDGHPNRSGNAPFYQWVTAAGAQPAQMLAYACKKGLYAVYSGTTAGFVTLGAKPMVR